jgi:alkanesulfonate monooxygenase SsuD/methylene tetrahydromethanopterin reductase-like flavin-dependent oxidoreductase (luciferase family)
MRERVEAMRELWTRDVASYSGRYVSFGSSWQSPKPLQYPLPVYVGGNGEQVLDRVLRYGDHWMPNRERALETHIHELRRRAEEAGKGRPEVTFFGADLDPAMAERLANAGVDRVLLHLPPAGREEVETAVDRAAEIAASLGRRRREPPTGRGLRLKPSSSVDDLGGRLLGTTRRRVG